MMPRSPGKYVRGHPLSDWVVGGQLVAFAVLGVICVFVVPMGEGPDEIEHLLSVNQLRTGWQTLGLAYGPGGQLVPGHLPPLYHALGALVSPGTHIDDLSETLPRNPRFRWEENRDPGGWNVFLHNQPVRFPFTGTAQALYVLRLFSLLLGVTALYVSNRVLRLLLPGRLWVAVAACALIALNPAFIYSSSTVHHDPLVDLLFALGLWWMVRYAVRGGRWFQWLLAGLLSSAAAMTSLSGLALLAAVELALLIRSWRERDYRPVVWGGLVVLSIVVLAAGWWYVRAADSGGILWRWPGPQAGLDESGPGTDDWGAVWNRSVAPVVRQFWGAFGSLHILPPAVARRVLWMLTAEGAVGLALGLWRRRGLRPWSEQRYAHVACLGAVVPVSASMVWASVASAGRAQGSDLYGLLAPLMAWTCLGLSELFGRQTARVWATGIAVGMLGYATYAIAVFLPSRYSLPQTVSRDTLDALAPVAYSYENGIELLSFSWSPDPAPPGTGATLCTYWRLAGWQGEDIRVRATLRDRLGEMLDYPAEFWPVDNGFPPAAWQRGAAYEDCRTFYIPPNAYVGQSSVLVERLDPGTGVPVSEQMSLELPVAIGEPVDGGFGSETAELARLGEHIALVGLDVPFTARAGKDASVTLYWQTDSELQENYVVFVQVLSAEGLLVAQKDNEPREGQYPTSIWMPGQVVADSYRIPIPGDLTAGKYQVIVGMYTWPALERLAVSVGGQVVGDHYRLAVIEIESS